MIPAVHGTQDDNVHQSDIGSEDSLFNECEVADRCLSGQAVGEGDAYI